MGVLKWLRRRWYLPLLAALAFLGWILRLASTTPGRVLERENAAIDAGERARLREAEVGRDLANAEADQEYAEALRGLNAKQTAKANRMRSNHGARVAWLSRISAKQNDAE